MPSKSVRMRTLHERAVRGSDPTHGTNDLCPVDWVRVLPVKTNPSGFENAAELGRLDEPACRH